MSTMVINPTADAVQFLNNATETGVLNGQLTIGHDRQRRDFNAYALHWGNNQTTNNETQKIGLNSLISEYGADNIGSEETPQYVFNQPLVYNFENTTVPLNATHLLIFATDLSGQEILYGCRSLTVTEHLLPSNATRLERSLAATTSRLGQVPVVLDSLWDPSRCPTPFLPWLAWATSVDIWFDDQDDAARESIRRRELIRKSAFVHQHKGTRAAIQQALDAFSNVSITLTEWWQQTPRGAPHTFQLDLLVNSNTSGVGSAELTQQLRQVIDAIKPVRSHYTFTISTVQIAAMRFAANTEAVSYKRFNMAATLP